MQIKIYICTGIIHVVNVLIGFVTCRCVNIGLFYGVKESITFNKYEKEQTNSENFAPPPPRNLMCLF